MRRTSSDNRQRAMIDTPSGIKESSQHSRMTEWSQPGDKCTRSDDKQCI